MTKVMIVATALSVFSIVQPDVWKFRVCVLTHLGIPI